MDYDNLMVDIGDDYVASVTLNRPEHLNTFNTPLARELIGALEELDRDTRVRVIVIKGQGQAFCAGIDIKEFFEKSTMEYRQWVELMEKPLFIISQMRKPVIAQVHGVAAANGAGLVGASDLAIAAENARIGLTAINVGLNCVGPVIPVSRSIGRKRALEMLYFGEMVKAKKALEMGLINKVVPEDDLEGETRRWAARLAKKSPVAMQIAKQAFYASADMDYQQSFDYMNEAFARLCSTEDAKEGVSAFLERRKPDWKEK